MVRSYKFAVLRVGASAPRDERLNIGLVIFDDTHFEVRLPRSLAKLGALSHAIEEDTVRNAAAHLRQLDELFSDEDQSAEARIARLADMSPFDFSALGQLEARSSEALDQEVAQLLRIFVDPEPAHTRRRAKSSHLLTTLKKVFRQERVLAAKGEDLSAHRLLTRVELGTGLVADFVLKNGAMHVIETIDASDENSSPIKAVKDIALSALTIEQAKISFLNEQTRGRLVYNASAQVETMASSALQAAEHQGIELVNWASDDDQRRLVSNVTSLATPLPRKRAASSSIHASAQHKFEIN